MLEWLRSMLGLKQITDDLEMLKLEVDQLREVAEAALTRDVPRDTDSKGSGWLEGTQAKKVLHSEGGDNDS